MKGLLVIFFIILFMLIGIVMANKVVRNSTLFSERGEVLRAGVFFWVSLFVGVLIELITVRSFYLLGVDTAFAGAGFAYMGLTFIYFMIVIVLSFRIALRKDS